MDNTDPDGAPSTRTTQRPTKTPPTRRPRHRRGTQRAKRSKTPLLHRTRSERRPATIRCATRTPRHTPIKPVDKRGDSNASAA